jgi:low affinity Fe/Cu permease
MFMDPIAAMSRFLMKITWTMCMMVICIISMRIIGMSAPLMDASNTLNMSINMDPTVGMSPFHMVITLITYTTGIYTPPTATTGTNTNPVLLVQNRCVFRKYSAPEPRLFLS